MATGHINPGYINPISNLKAAIGNPSGARHINKLNSNELEEIKAKARQVWSVKDNSETTYGFYYNDPMIKEKAGLRPSSSTRRNNPHPHLVFLSSHLKSIPGYFNQPSEQREETIEVFKPENSSVTRVPSVRVYQNANNYIKSLEKDDAEIEEKKLLDLGIDTKSNNLRPYSSYGRNQNIINHFSSQNDFKFKSESNIDLSTNQTNRLYQLQSNMTNPYLYEDTRMYKEKYKNGDHGIPYKNPRRPYRGDFLIHPDWHPGLKHHRLPYM